MYKRQNYYSPWELERAIARFVDYYNHKRVHEAIGNVTPDDMYHDRQREIFTRREKIKRLTLLCLSTSLRRQTVIGGGVRGDRTEQNAGEELVLVPALVEAEHELVQVTLKVLRADPVEGSA